MFLNNSKLGPSAKVALMHYQMEATKMFDTDIDQLARALLVGIWRNANLITHIMPPSPSRRLSPNAITTKCSNRTSSAVAPAKRK